MAGFETIVRPMIFPSIRPAPRPSVLPAETDPAKGLVVIRGQSARTVELPYSYSLTWTVTMASRETSRRVDVARVYQKPPQQPPGGSASTRAEGAINRDNYVDIEVANRITMEQPGGTIDYHYAPVEASDNVEILRKNIVKRVK